MDGRKCKGEKEMVKIPLDINTKEEKVIKQ